MTGVVNVHWPCLLTLKNLRAGAQVPLSLHQRTSTFLLHLGCVLSTTSPKEGEPREGSLNIRPRTFQAAPPQRSQKASATLCSLATPIGHWVALDIPSGGPEPEPGRKYRTITTF